MLFRTLCYSITAEVVLGQRHNVPHARITTPTDSNVFTLWWLWSTIRLTPTIRSIAMGNRWSGPMKLCILWFPWSAPLVSHSNWLDCRTEFESRLGPLRPHQKRAKLVWKRSAPWSVSLLHGNMTVSVSQKVVSKEGWSFTRVPLSFECQTWQFGRPVTV